MFKCIIHFHLRVLTYGRREYVFGLILSNFVKKNCASMHPMVTFVEAENLCSVEARCCNSIDEHVLHCFFCIL